MNISIKKLTITNFKGVRNLEVNFGHTTEISGANESGKTSIFDAFCFVLKQKNSEDEKQFGIKNFVDTSLNKLDHTVKALFDVDGAEISFTVIYREKWETKRGESVKVFTGHELGYAVNDVSKSQKEYKSELNKIIPEQLMGLITNPFAFNSIESWEERRQILVKIAGDPSDADMAQGDKDFTALLKQLNGKTIEQFKAEIAAKKKPMKETIKEIPPRIEECGRSKPEPDDFDAIAISIEEKKKLIEKVDLAISGKVKAHREESVLIIKKQNDLNKLKSDLINLEADEKRNSQKELNEVESKITNTQFSITKDRKGIETCTTEINHLRSKIKNLEIENVTLRENKAAIAAEVMPEMSPDATCCPSCKQSLPADKIETIKSEFVSNWNADRNKRSATINTKGLSNKADIESYEAAIKKHETGLKELDNSINAATNGLTKLEAKRTELSKQKKQTESPAITALKKQIADFPDLKIPNIKDAELKAQKLQLQTEVDELKVKFGKKEQIEKVEARILELETQERALAQSIADLEKTEFAIDKFTRAKMDYVEGRVNSMFHIVKFRMFETQINGGIAEACTCLVKGVPWSDVNTAGKIQGGLDIINCLSGFYNIYAPVFIDNRESCADIPHMFSQIINLVHIPHQELKIS